MRLWHLQPKDRSWRERPGAQAIGSDAGGYIGEIVVAGVRHACDEQHDVFRSKRQLAIRLRGTARWHVRTPAMKSHAGWWRRSRVSMSCWKHLTNARCNRAFGRTRRACLRR
jgi:hypothetical protein